MNKKLLFLFMFVFLIASGVYINAQQALNSADNVLLLGDNSVLTRNDPNFWYDRSNDILELGGVGSVSGRLGLSGSTSGKTIIAPQAVAGSGTVTALSGITGAMGVGFVTDVILCGQQANNGTIFMSPVTGFATGALYAAGATAADISYIQGGSGCDAEDSATESTADEILYANNAFKVIGMFCSVSGSGSNGVTLTLRSAEANLTPSITVTIPTTETTSATNTVTTTDIAAGATFALSVTNTEDLSLQDAWCVAKVVLVP